MSRAVQSGSGASTPPSESTSLLSDVHEEGEVPDFAASDYGSLARGGVKTLSAGLERPEAQRPTHLARSASLARKADRRKRRSEHLSAFSTRARYYIPVLNWLPEYSVEAFVGDLTAAFTMTSLIVPQSMSYATNLAKLSPVNGLYGAAIPPIIYSLLGTCRQLSVGPEAALSLIIGEAITKFVAAEQHAHGDMTDGQKLQLGLLISSVITFEAGVISLALGLLRLGFLDAVLSRALLRGFITAVGLVIAIAQFIPILGLERLLGDTILESAGDKFTFVIENLSQTHLLTFFVSLAALVFLVLAKTFKARLVTRRGFHFLAYVPEVLVVVVVSTILCEVFRWDLQGLHVLGKVSAGSAKIRLPFHKTGDYLRSCLGTSTVIAILGFLDSIVAAKDCASLYNYPISPNRELVALGAANVLTSTISGTIPGFGSITRSRLAGSTGATTQMASLLTGLGVLLVSFFLLGLLFFLPTCILAVIICVVVWSILSEAPHDVIFFWRMRAWIDFSLMAMTFILTLFVNVETGIVVSLLVSGCLCIRESAAMRVKILGRVPGTNFFEPVDDEGADDEGPFPGEEIPGVLIVRIRDLSLTFANAGTLKERLRRLERYGKGRHHPSARPTRAEASVIIFHLADVEDIDASALQLLLEIVHSYVNRSVLVYWCHLNAIPRARLEKSGVLALSGDESHVQYSVQAALNALNDTMLSVSTVHP